VAGESDTATHESCQNREADLTSRAMPSRAVLAIALLLPLTLTACRKSVSDVISDLHVSNRTDTYTYQLDPGTHSLTTRDHWHNTGTTATLEIEIVPTSGIGSITIQDASNGTVLRQNVTETGTFETDSGQAGDWIITTILSNAEGVLKFSIKKK